jgi:DNA helicase-2/ATP-dependent DNA helicase PcrA
LAYLRLLYNPDDELSQTRALKIGKKRYAGFRDYASKVSRGKAGSKTENKLQPTTRELVEGVLEATRYLKRFDEDDPEDLVRIENVKELLSVAEVYPELGQFLEQVALVERETLARKEDKDTVTLMTLHAAKGLEFPHVFIAGIEEGLLPHSRSVETREDLEEERRLMYVGITRAMNQLYLMYARSRLVFGARGVCVPSRFISEIDDKLLEKLN